VHDLTVTPGLVRKRSFGSDFLKESLRWFSKINYMEEVVLDVK
jgi:hypothetical protein